MQRYMFVLNDYIYELISKYSGSKRQLTPDDYEQEER